MHRLLIDTADTFMLRGAVGFERRQQTMTSWSALYYVMLVISGAFFLLNLVVAVIISNLSIERAKQQRARVADKAAKWVDMADKGKGLEFTGKSAGGAASLMAQLVAQHHKTELEMEEKKEQEVIV